MEGLVHQGPVVQSPISSNPGLTVNKTYGVIPGLKLIGLLTTGSRIALSFLQRTQRNPSSLIDEPFDIVAGGVRGRIHTSYNVSRGPVLSKLQSKSENIGSSLGSMVLSSSLINELFDIVGEG